MSKCYIITLCWLDTPQVLTHLLNCQKKMHIVCRRVEVMAAQPFEARGVDGGRFPTQLGPKKLTLQLSELALSCKTPPNCLCTQVSAENPHICKNKRAQTSNCEQLNIFPWTKLFCCGLSLSSEIRFVCHNSTPLSVNLDAILSEGSIHIEV